MKLISFLVAILFLCNSATAKEAIYTGSTLAHRDVRVFLGISLTDSIDFIRWKLTLNDSRYSLNCQYGISKGGTPGFIDAKKAAFSGTLVKQAYYYVLQQGNKSFYLLHINDNLLHLLDKNKNFLIGDGSYSYALNSTTPSKSSQFNYPTKQNVEQQLMIFQGRTPCQELSKLLGRETTVACNKIKWYFILYTDPSTKKPTYYLQGGRQYKKATMKKGRWAIVQKNGRTIYELHSDEWRNPLYLLKAGDKFLFITDADGNLLVGDENFSYTLYRTIDKESSQ